MEASGIHITTKIYKENPIKDNFHFIIKIIKITEEEEVNNSVIELRRNVKKFNL